MVFLWVAVITVLICSICSEAVIRGAYVGHVEKGAVVSGDAFPYLLYMEISLEEDDGEEDIYICGGILIKPNIALTAGHCLVVCGKITSILVWAGVSNLAIQSKSGQRNYAKYYRIHKDFGGMGDGASPTFLHNDIGLIWLHKSFDLKNGVKLAKIPDHSVVSLGDKGWSAGWGETEIRRLSLLLKKVQLETIPKSRCEEFYTADDFNGKNFCAKSVIQKSGLAHGDSGGPLVINGVVTGIVSYGCTSFETFANGTEIRQCDTSHPTIFTNIFEFNDWILWNIRDVGKRSVIRAAKKIAITIAKLCNGNLFKYLRRGRLARQNLQWNNATVNLPPPTLI